MSIRGAADGRRFGTESGTDYWKLSNFMGQFMAGGSAPIVVLTTGWCLGAAAKAGHRHVAL